MRNRITPWMTIPAIALLLLPCYFAFAFGDDAATGDGATGDGTAKPIAALTKTVKLEFKLEGPEQPTTLPVMCALKEYSVSHDISEPNHEHFIRVAGTLAPFDDRGRVLLTYHASTTHSDLNEGFDATFKTRGSAILKPGTQQTLAVLGDQPLTVRATVED